MDKEEEDTGNMLAVKRKGNVQMLKSKANKNEKDIDDPAVERDFVVLIKKYLKGDALKDFLANVPFIAYIIAYGIPKEDPE